MAKDEKIKRLGLKKIQADKNSFVALKSFRDYKPANEQFTVSRIAILETDMLQKQELETEVEKALKSRRDDANDAEWAYHNAILGSKDQVVAQYTINSNEVQEMGLKKKSEYKRPSVKKKD